MISEIKLERFIAIYKYVSNHNYPTQKEINNYLDSLGLGGLPKRTFSKYMEELQNAGISVKYNTSTRGYFIKSTDYDYFEKIVDLES